MNRPLMLVSMSALAGVLSAQRIAEVEPNDSALTAMPISPGQHVDANLVANTQDWYSFTLAGSTQVHVTTCGNFAVSSTVDTVVLLYDATGTTRLAWNDQQRGSHSDMGATLPAGTYTVLVIGKLTTTAGDYGLDFITYAAATPTNVEGAEPNGDPATGGVPTPITLGGVFTGDLSTPTDEDWFAFTLTGRSIVQAIVYDDGGVPQLDTANLALRQETSPGVWAAIGTASAPTGSHRSLTMSHTATLGAGNYALRIAAGASTGGTAPQNYVRQGAYGVRTLLLALPGASTVTEATEPNNTPAAAPFMSLGDQATGNISGSNEGDWYGVVIPAATTIAILSENGTPTPITDTTVRLWDATGTITLATGSTGGTGSHGRVIFTVNIPGIYYVEIAGGVLAAAGDYVLHVGAAPAMFVSATFTQQPPSTNACPGSNTLRPQLNRANGEVPQLGSHFVMRLNNALPGAFLIGGLGFSNTTALGGTLPLPFELLLFGAPGCFLRVDPEIQNLGVADGSGIWFWDLPVPGNTAFLGVTAYAQVMLNDPTNPGGLSMSNDVRLVVGDRGY